MTEFLELFKKEMLDVASIEIMAKICAVTIYGTIVALFISFFVSVFEVLSYKWTIWSLKKTNKYREHNI